uniref:Uncharacterized protein n=1 Tax=Triticum urartu TaxID=4572 RepID=A0A8R7Q3G7_TRIUA
MTATTSLHSEYATALRLNTPNSSTVPGTVMAASSGIAWLSTSSASCLTSPAATNRSASSVSATRTSASPRLGTAAPGSISASPTWAPRYDRLVWPPPA